MVIEGLISLVSYGGFGGGTIGNLLAQWEAAGIFQYALPFLLIFALVFAILSFVPVFEKNKGIVAIISLVTALMALQFNMVSIFFAEIFPRLGIGLSIILVVIVLAELFIDKDNHGLKWVFIIVVLIVTIVVISSSLKAYGFGFGSGTFLRYNWPEILGVVLVVGAIIAIVAGSSSNNNRKIPEVKIPFLHSN